MTCSLPFACGRSQIEIAQSLWNFERSFPQKRAGGVARQLRTQRDLTNGQIRAQGPTLSDKKKTKPIGQEP